MVQVETFYHDFAVSPTRSRMPHNHLSMVFYSLIDFAQASAHFNRGMLGIDLRFVVVRVLVLNRTQVSMGPRVLPWYKEVPSYLKKKKIIAYCIEVLLSSITKQCSGGRCIH